MKYLSVEKERVSMNKIGKNPVGHLQRFPKKSFFCLFLDSQKPYPNVELDPRQSERQGLGERRGMDFRFLQRLQFRLQRVPLQSWFEYLTMH